MTKINAPSDASIIAFINTMVNNPSIVDDPACVDLFFQMTLDMLSARAAERLKQIEVVLAKDITAMEKQNDEAFKEHMGKGLSVPALKKAE